MTFVYTPGIPLGTNIPAQSAPLFAANFSYINSMLSRDHSMTLNSANVNDGTHKQVTLTNQSAPGFTGGNGALYAALRLGNSWPVWQNALGSTFLTTGPTSAGSNGFTYLTGGILLQWGQIVTGSTSGTVTFSAANVAFPTACFAVFAVPFYTGGVPSSAGNITTNTATLSATKFDWKLATASGTYTGFYWLAIGN